MKFLKKNLSNIIFFVFIVFLFTPYGLPVRATFIKAVSFVTTRVFSIEVDKKDQIFLEDYNWELIDLEGNATNLKSYKGKVIVVNFWATWCPPCIAEMPSFQKLYDNYESKVVFLFVANDEPKKVENFIKDKSYDLPVYFQRSNSPSAIDSNALPTTFVIDSKGMIVAKKVGAADWNSSNIRELLDKLIP